MKLIQITTLGITVGLFGLGVSCNRPPAKVHFGENSATGDSNPDGTGNTTGTGSADNGEVTVPTALTFSTGFPRLTQLQWENSVRDVLLLDAQPNLSSLFPGDPQNTFFANDGNSLVVSDGLWQSYVKAAETLSDKIGADKTAQGKLVPAEAAALTGDAKAKAIITPLATRAFRRPPTDAQVARLLAVYNNGPKTTGKTDAVAAGLQAVVYMLMQSPYFLYRVELGNGTEPEDLTTLNGYEVAARLSYAAWNTIPDKELLAAAASGEILTDEGLLKQATRLMNDPKANDNLNYFYKKILGTDTYIDVQKKDPSIAKSWPDDMGKVLTQEAELFINEVVVKEKGGINQILSAPYAFVNAKTAPFYNVSPPSGDGFVKTTLDPKQRIGFLTQVGSLARRSEELESNAIRRGVLVVDKLLCTNVSSNIPPNVGKLDPPSGKLTSRDIVNAKSGPGTCGAACHGKFINPAGYAFENYDAAGNWRTVDNGQPVNAAADLTLTTGEIHFNGPQDFVKQITASKDLHNCLTQKAVGFLYARAVDKEDESLVDAIAQKSADNIATRDMFIQLLTDSRIKLRGNKGK